MVRITTEKAKKTIKAKVNSKANQNKLNILDRELERWDEITTEVFEEGKTDYHDVKTDERYGAYVTYATFKIDTPDHPLPLKNTVFDVDRKENSVSDYWACFPSKERRGGVWLPIDLPKKYYGFEEEWEIRDSHITTEDDEYYFHISIEKEVRIEDDYNGVLGIDLGVRHVAVTWNTSTEKPKFYGKELRHIRGKYHYLRRKLQSEKKIEAVEKISDRENRKADYQLHQISRDLVDRAQEQDLAIFIGDLSGHRDTDFGDNNRRLHSAPVNKLKRFIKYKAQEAGVLCKVIDEAYTTVTCAECGHERDSRPGKEFCCPKCGYQVNSDVNGAKNIAERGFGYISESGAFAVSPNPASNDPIDGFSDDRENRSVRTSVDSSNRSEGGTE